ncbi:riboflavin synthase, alpha subunit [Treponema sp. JC4]|uniref:riboflavin synthase n=1 Tax=Treponema sp. JC4 TaxID=1124982 RepID=UPI00025B02AB|nr:riboflavin synthase [Treponema sp. JC4]EID85508.1 riboflavin synthase, alpha subunit [Treponema sp. JC4]
MFTGIVETVGVVEKCDASSLFIKADKILETTHIGDSIAVNGVCLTVTRLADGGFYADVMPETLSRSNLGQLTCGARVNLERAMAADGRFGGHIVSGHIDGRGKITKILKDGNAVRFWISAAEGILRLIVEKGSITVDGISLTVAGVSESDFSISIIPHTLGETTLGDRRVGDSVNLENDIIGKYVERLLGGSLLQKNQSARDEKLMAWLAE